MSKFITHRMTLLSLAYCDFWKMVAAKIGITEEEVLAKLKPTFKETKDGKLVGKDRCDRFMFWANCRTVNEDSHYDRLRILEEYIRLIYPRLLREVQKDAEIAMWNNTPKKSIKPCTSRKRKQENPDQLTFDFGEIKEG